MNQEQSISKGWQWVRQGQFSVTIKEWLRDLQASECVEDELPYWIALGRQFREALQPERALSLHQHAYAVLGDEPYLRCLVEMNLCLDLLALGQRNLAEKLLARAFVFENVSLCPVLQELLSQIYTALGRHEDAAVALELAIENSGGDAMVIAECTLALLVVYAKASNISTARLSRAIEMANQSLPLLDEQARPMAIELGRACERLGRAEEAATYFKLAMSMPVPLSAKKTKPRRLAMVEYKLQQITSDIEIEMLREKNAAQHQHVQQLETAGFRDDITGLYNARYLSMRWDDLNAQAEQGAMLCMLSIGINLFASISEVLGKDLALLTYIQISQILQSECADDAILMTSGTGSFELILLNHDQARVEAMIRVVQAKIAAIELAYLPEALGISVGGAYFEPPEARDIFQLRANLALFLAQRKECTQICWDGDA